MKTARQGGERNQLHPCDKMDIDMSQIEIIFSAKHSQIL